MGDFSVATGSRQETVDVTDQIQREVAASGIQDGFCLVYTPHTTCGVAVNEGYDPAVQSDFLQHSAKMIPIEAGWGHAEGNSDSHIKAILVGSRATLPVAGGRLRLGRWQAVFLCEFDGPRRREVWVSVR